MRTSFATPTATSTQRPEAGFAMRLGRGPGAAGDARRAVTAFLDGRLSEDRLDDVLLVVSELVTNAVLHGTGEIRLRITCDAHHVAGAVTDDGGGFARAERAPDRRGIGGHGLHIVGRVAEHWGCGDETTHVWFEIPTGAEDGFPAGPRG